MSLTSLAQELNDATRGYDWKATAVSDLVQRLLTRCREADRSELDAAVSVLCERIARSQLDDSDGVAHCAITAGTMVESGADPRPLGEVLRAKMPPLLEAARRFADTCLAEIADPESEDAMTDVDDVAIPRALFRAKLPADRAGGVALAYLHQWALPCVASWTRDRAELERATRDQPLVAAAAAMRLSDAYFVHVLLGVELDAQWLVVLPLDGRGFEVRVDGVVGNYDLHALLAEALSTRGVPVATNLESVLANLRTDCRAPERAIVRGSWNMYSYRAAVHDLRTKVPTDIWVWGEGAPRDIPKFEGRRTLLLGPQAPSRTWNAGRTFARLFASVTVERELPSAEVTRLLAAMREAN